MKLHLKGGRLVDPVSGRDELVDLVIVGGRIEKIGPNLSVDSTFRTLDMKGRLVVPGLLDMHVHLREPGYEHKETIESGCSAAAAGGFTGVCCMPNTNPAIDDESVARYVSETGRRALGGIVDVYPIAAVTKGRKGEELAPMAELAGAGAVGFSDDGSPVESAEIMRRALEYSSMFGVPIIQHAEDPSLTRGGAMNEGYMSTKLGLPGIPSVAEEIMVSRDVTLLRYLGKGRYHVAHVSAAGTLEVIRRAKAEKLPVTCEVTPHHFSMTDEAVESYDTSTKMHPPLRSREDVQAVKEALRDGTVDVIATDHAPHSHDEKEVEYTEAPFGIVGLETAFGLAVTELVDAGYLTLKGLIEKLSTNPRRIVGLPPILIREGEMANLTLLDPDHRWTVDRARLKSKSKNTPFHGRELKGKAFGIINNGQVMLF